MNDALEGSFAAKIRAGQESTFLCQKESNAHGTKCTGHPAMI
jgi:hypothetical protein